MKLYKRILIIFLLLIICLSVKSFASSDEVTYNGITAEVPKVYQYSDGETAEDDPLLDKISSEVGASSSYDISSMISIYETGEVAVGIDVSYYQGDIDWEAVADSGVKFAIIRCGYRGYSTGNIVEDSKFEENIQEAIDNGIYVGVYFYSTAINEEEALQEAVTVVDLIKNYDIKYPVAYDFEDFGTTGKRTDGLSNDQINANAKVFLDYINSQGYIATLYGSTSYLNNIWSEEIRTNYDVWVAQYNTSVTYTGNYTMWQRTSSGIVSGISGYVDIDIDYEYYMSYNNVDLTNYLFNSTYYADMYSDLKEAFGYDETLLKQHYETYGKAEGRVASPVFDPVYYLSNYSDLKAAFGTNYVEAYNHFITYGAKEGRQASKYFSSTYYLSKYSDVKKVYYSSKTWAIAHFMEYGISEGRQGSSSFNVITYYNSQSSYTKYHLGTEYLKYYALDAGGDPINNSPIDITDYLFDSTYYADMYSDLKKAFGYNETLLKQHYETYGKAEGRTASPVFNPVYYLSNYSDLKEAFGTNYVEAYNHFINYGINEGRQASSTFNVVAYINNYSDLKTVFGTNYSKALEHYMVYGIAEGRSGI